MADETLAVGIVGAGILGKTHAMALHAQERARLVAVADVAEGKAAQLAEAFGAKAFDDVGEMLAAEDIDVVVIATPDPFHKAPFLACAEAGVRAILCEKPLATTVADAEEMLDAADRKGVRVFVDFENRFARADMATRHIVQHRLIGDPVYADIRLDDNISVPRALWGNRSRDWAAQSSTAHFLMSHTSDLVLWWFAPARVERVFAVSQKRVLGYAPDLYEAMLFLSNGMKVRLKSEWIRHQDTIVEFEEYIGGSEGSVFYNKRPGFGMKMGWKANLRKSLDFPRLVALQEKFRANGIIATASMVAEDDLCGGGTHPALEIGPEGADNISGWPLFIDAILNDTDAPASWGFGALPTGRDGYEAVKIVAAIVESAETGAIVELNSGAS